MPDQYANAECISSAKRVAISRTPCRAEVGIGIGSFCKGFWLVVLLIPCHLTAFPSFCFCLFTLSAEWMRRGIRCRSNHLTCQPIGVCHQMSFNPPEPTQSTHSTPVRSLGWWNMQGKCNHYWFCGLFGTENSELNWTELNRSGKEGADWAFAHISMLDYPSRLLLRLLKYASRWRSFGGANGQSNGWGRLRRPRTRHTH